MKRALVTGLLALMLTGSPVGAADWRPEVPGGGGDALAAFDAEMAPILVQAQTIHDAIVQDFSTVSDLFMFSSVDAVATDMEARLAAAKQLPLDIKAGLDLAHDALAVMDAAAPDPCWSDYYAVLRTGWLTYGDALDSISVGAMGDANQYVGVAMYLLGTYGSLIHDQSVKDCG